MKRYMVFKGGCRFCGVSSSQNFKLKNMFRQREILVQNFAHLKVKEIRPHEFTGLTQVFIYDIFH